jgi:hypothetical protein
MDNARTQQAKEALLLLAASLGPALRAFGLTMAGVSSVGLVLALLSGLAAGGGWGWLWMFAVLVGFVCIAWFLALQRAIWTAVVALVQRSQAAAHATEAIFSRMFGLRAGGAFSDRGNQAARVLERLPLAQAEELLRQAVAALLPAQASASGIKGWILQRAQQRLSSLIEQVTLARFREASASEGGIDLDKVRTELVKQIDQTVEKKASATMNQTTKLWLGLGALLALGGAFAIRLWVNHA